MDSKRARGEGPSGQPGGGSSSREDVGRLLSDFQADQQERKKRRDAAAVPKEDRRNKVLIPILAVLAVLTAWVWLAPPAFLLPEPLPEPSEAEVLAGLRLQMFGAAVQILAHQDQTGQLPGSLDDVAEDPADVEGILYQRFSDREFVLVGTYGEVSVTYDSSEPVDVLLEPVRNHIQEADVGAGEAGGSP